MAGISVGSVSISVVPDARGFPGALRTQILPEMSRIGDEIAARITAPIVARLRDAIPEGLSLGGRAAGTTGGKAGEDYGGAFARAVKTRIEAALKDLPKTQVDIATTDAERRIQELRAELVTLRDARVGVDIGGGDALVRIREISTELRNLGSTSPDIQVRADTAAAAAELAEIQVEADRLDGRKVDVKVDDKGSIGRAQGGLSGLATAALGLGPALVPIGAVAVGALGAMGGAAVAAGIGAGVAKLAFSGIGEAVTALGARGPAAIAKVDKAMSGLAPAGRSFATFLFGLKGQLSDLQSIAQRGLLPGVEVGIRAVEPLFPVLKGVINDVSLSIGGLARDAGAALNDPFWRSFFGYLQSTAGPAIRVFGAILGDLAKGFAGLLQGFDPVVKSVEAGLLSLSARFADFGATLGTNSGFQRFIQYIQTEGPVVFSTIAQVAAALGRIVTAFAPIGGATLTTLKLFAEAINAIPVGVLQVVASVVGPLAVGMKVLAVATAAFGRAAAIGETVTKLGGGLTFLGDALAAFQVNIALAGGGITGLVAVLAPVAGIIAAIGIPLIAGIELWRHWGDASKAARDEVARTLASSPVVDPNSTRQIREQIAAIDDKIAATKREQAAALAAAAQNADDSTNYRTAGGEQDQIIKTLTADKQKLIERQTALNTNLQSLTAQYGVSTAELLKFGAANNINFAAPKRSDIALLDDYFKGVGPGSKAFIDAAANLAVFKKAVADNTKTMLDAVPAFDTYTAKSTVTTKSIAAALAARAKILADEDLNIKKLIARGIAPDLLAALEKQGPEYVDAVTKASAPAFTRMQANWRAGTKAATDAGTAVASQGGRATGQGFAGGILSRVGAVQSAAQLAFQRQTDIASAAARVAAHTGGLGTGQNFADSIASKAGAIHTGTTTAFAPVLTGVAGLGRVIRAVPTVAVKATTSGFKEAQSTLQAFTSQIAKIGGITDLNVAARVAKASAHLAGGGMVAGPGSGTSDSIPAMLSNGEHVWTAAEVARAGGHHVMYALRKVLGGFGGFTHPGAAVARFAGGGAVEHDFNLIASAADVAAVTRGLKTLSSLGGSISGGVSQWAGLVARIVAQLGLGAEWIPLTMRRIQIESGGNPRAINLTDSNFLAGHPSQGLMQTIPGTFDAWAGVYRSLGITNPAASIYAGLNYASHVHGYADMMRRNAEGIGYHVGGIVPGTGDVPIVAKGGEGVFTEDQMRQLAPADRSRSYTYAPTYYGWEPDPRRIQSQFRVMELQQNP